MKKAISLLLSLVSFLFLFPASSQAFIPIPDENGEYEYDEDGNLVVSDMSVEDMGSFRRRGSINVDQEVIDLLGYDPNREWNEGDRPEDVLTFGDLESYGFQLLTIRGLNSGSNAGNITLDKVGIIQNLSLRELARTVADLSERLVSEVDFLRDTFPEYLQNFKLGQIFDLNAGELSDEVRKRVQGEIDGYIEDEINENQKLILTGIADGIGYATSNIEAQITASFPEESMPLDLQAVGGIVEAAAQKKIDLARQSLQEEMTIFLAENYNQTSAEIQMFIDEKLEEYRAEIDIAANIAFEDLKVAVGEEIVKQAGSVVEELDLNAVEGLFEDYRQLVGDFADGIVDTVQKDISNFTQKELDKISNIANEIPDDLGSLKINNFALENYTVADIPGLSDTAIREFENYKTTTFSEVPGASGYSFSRLPNFNVNFGTGIARVDLVLGKAEQFTDRAISGSLRETFNRANCRKSKSLNGGCAHIELAKVDPLFFNAGKQWVSGDSQRVNGGKNLLRYYGGGKEPTGRLPFYGSRLKMVLRNNDEQTDTVDLSLALQICFTDVFGIEHCTPHNVLEFYIHTFKVRDLIFLGITI